MQSTTKSVFWRTRPPWLPLCLAIACATAFSLPPSQAMAHEEHEQAMQQMMNRMEQMMRRIDYLEQKLANVEKNDSKVEKTQEPETAAAKSSAGLDYQLDLERTPPVAEPVTKVAHAPEDKPGKVSLKLGGRARLEVMASSVSTGSTVGGANTGDYYLFASLIPTDSTGEKDQITFSARNSRLWLDAAADSEHGPIKAKVEVDFWGSAGNERVSNSHNIRLRHAYAEFAGFTFGQTSSTFFDGGSWPANLMDPVGILYARQPLVRFDWKLTDDNTLSLGLEQPETTLTDSSGTTITPDDDQIPDTALRFTANRSWGHISMAGILREIRADGAKVTGTSDSKIGGAVLASGKIKTVGKDDIRFTLAYGKPLGRYAAYNAFNDGAIDDSGNITLTPMYSGYLSYQHWWNETWRSVASYSRAGVDNDTAIDTAPKWAESYHINLGFEPMENLYTGFEYAHARKKLESGTDGDLDRMIWVTSYAF